MKEDVKEARIRERRLNHRKMFKYGLNEQGSGTYFVAMPEHLASVFRATRSPNRIFLTGPRTVAQCSTGLTTWPSNTFHSTLHCYLSLCCEVVCILEEKNGLITYIQSNCLNTSSKKGTPARTPWRERKIRIQLM